MKGDVILVEPHHRRAADQIVERLRPEIESMGMCYVLTVAGESGSGKSETGKALQDVLGEHQIRAILLGQDDYFFLPPKANDARRRQDPDWLGPHVEVNLSLLEQNIMDACAGKTTIDKPLMDYDKNAVLDERVNLVDVAVLIVEGTYTSLLRNVHKRVFIDRDYRDTLAHRKTRARGEEADDPFIEKVLATEHKIIAGHKHLADIVITKDYDLVFAEKHI